MYQLSVAPKSAWACLQVIFALADEVRRLPPNEEKQEDLELGIEALCRNASRLEPAQAARVAGLVAEYGHAGMAEVRKHCLRLCAGVSRVSPIMISLKSLHSATSLAVFITEKQRTHRLPKRFLRV